MEYFFNLYVIASDNLLFVVFSVRNIFLAMVVSFIFQTVKAAISLVLSSPFASVVPGVGGFIIGGIF
jgi:hypothetical protein